MPPSCNAHSVVSQVPAAEHQCIAGGFSARNDASLPKSSSTECHVINIQDAALKARDADIAAA